MFPPLCRDIVKMFLITSISITISHYYHHQVATGAVRVVEESHSHSPESQLAISCNTPVDSYPLKLLLHVLTTSNLDQEMFSVFQQLLIIF